ncbi:hypothetical protein MMC25_005798 [Agyrium rufum]|nr:hypothetical protein [Agyrium rufum]
MMRTAISQACRSALRARIPVAVPVQRFVLPSSSAVINHTPFLCSRTVGIRKYSAPAGLGQDEVEGRILDLLKNFDKVTDATKLSAKSHFSNDLGLDSLDTVEVVMAIEEEFSIEIPDKDADKIHSVDKAVEYILNQPDAH